MKRETEKEQLIIFLLPCFLEGVYRSVVLFASFQKYWLKRKNLVPCSLLRLQTKG